MNHHVARPRVIEHAPGIVGINLLRLRKAAGLTQNDIKERTGGVVDASEVSRIESGTTKDPGILIVKALADALGTTIDQLFVGHIPDNSSLREFLASPLGSSVSDSERAELERFVWPFGNANIESWHMLLVALRTRDRNPH